MYRHSYVATQLLVILLLYANVTTVFAESFDPTRPVIFGSKPQSKAVPREKVDKSAYEVTSILVSPHRRVAVINNQVVSAGEKVNKAKVVEINKSGVHLQVGRTVFVASLPSAVIEKRQVQASGSE